MWTLIALRQFLAASGRLWSILWRSDPWNGWPIFRAFLDLLERLAADQHPETVAPVLARLLEAIEARCPGVADAVLRARNPGNGIDRDPLGPAPEEAG